MSFDIPSNPPPAQPDLAMLTKELGVDQEPLMIEPETLLKEAIAQMSQGSSTCALAPSEDNDRPSKRHSYALVTQHQKLLGIVTERDMVRLSAEEVCFASTTVEQVMTHNVITLKASTIKDAFTPLNLMRQSRIRHLPIVDEQDNVCGVITAAKLREKLPASALLKRRQVQEVMAANVITASPTTLVIDIAKLMATHRVSCVVIQVSPSHPPQGIITEYDIVQVQRLALNLNQLSAEQVMSSPLACLHPHDQLSEVQQKMQALHVRRLVVVDDNGCLAGLVTQTSVLSVLDPHEMASTIEMLQQQVAHLQDERVQLLQTRNARLETQVKIGEISLLISEEKFRATFEQAAVGIAHLDLQGRFIAINHRLGEILGYPLIELYQHSFAEFTHHEDRVLGLAKLNRLVNGKVPSFSHESRYYRQDGSILWGNITVSSAIQPSGAPGYLIAVLEDISDRKQAEAALQELNQELGVRVSLRTIEVKASERRYRMLFESAPDLLFVLNMQGEIQQVNSAVTHRLGYTNTELQGCYISDLVVATIDTDYRKQFSNLLDQSIHHQEMELRGRNGHTLYVECASKVITDLAGQEPYILVIQRDITARKQLEIRLRSAEQQMRTVFEAMHDVVLVCTVEDGQIVTIDLAPTTPPETQQTSGDLASQTVQFLWDNLEKEAGHSLQTVINTGKPAKYEYRILMEDHEHHFLASISPMSEDTVLWVARDISELKRGEQALFREKELAQVTLQSIGDAVITTDTQGNIDQLNPVAEKLTGWKTTEAKGRPLSEVMHIVHEETRQPAENPIQKALREGKIVDLAAHTVLISRDHTEYGIEDSAAPIRDRNGNIIGAVMVFHDATQSRHLTRQLSWQASHDSLTQLINRRKFEQVLTAALQTAHQERKHHTLCFLDLDRFKIINDTCGHSTGDDVLRQVSKLFQQGIRTHDTLARLGGDEFAILLYDCPIEQAIEIAEGICQAVAAFQLYWMDKVFKIGVSVGIAHINQDSPDLATILGEADTACYAAKANGRNRIQIYNANMAALTQQFKSS